MLYIIGIYNVKNNIETILEPSHFPYWAISLVLEFDYNHDLIF